LLASLQTFSPNAADDAVIRANTRDELARLPLPQLALAMHNPVADADLARVWQCALAGQSAAAGKLPDWSAIPIPGQAEALKALDAVKACVAEADLIVGATSGQSGDPVRKLVLGHLQNAAAGKPTAHNSPGRPLPS